MIAKLLDFLMSPAGQALEKSTAERLIALVHDHAKTEPAPGPQQT